MYRQNETLLKLLQPAVTALGYELLGIELGNRGRSELLRIYIDHANGIGVEDCARVSEQVSGVLDVEDPLRGQYTLEVSSPGLDRPLFTLAQFARHLGSEAQIRLRQPLQERRRLRGIIEAVDDNNVVLRVEDEACQVAADLIEHARLIPVFD